MHNKSIRKRRNANLTLIQIPAKNEDMRITNQCQKRSKANKNNNNENPAEKNEDIRMAMQYEKTTEYESHINANHWEEGRHANNESMRIRRRENRALMRITVKTNEDMRIPMQM